MSCYWCGSPCICRFVNPEARQPVSALKSAEPIFIPAAVSKAWIKDVRDQLNVTRFEWIPGKGALGGWLPPVNPYFEATASRMRDDQLALQRETDVLRELYGKSPSWYDAPGRSLASEPAIREHVNVMRARRAAAEAGLYKREYLSDNADDDCDCDEDDND
jgi:hypothetical protein